MNNILRPTLELTVIIPGMIQISLFYTFCNFLFANMLVQSQIQKTCHLLLLTNAWQYIKLATDSISCILWYKKCGLAPLFSGTCPHFYFLFRIFTCYILCSPESIFYIQPRMIQVHIHERFPLPLWIQALLCKIFICFIQFKHFSQPPQHFISESVFCHGARQIIW